MTIFDSIDQCLTAEKCLFSLNRLINDTKTVVNDTNITIQIICFLAE